MTQLETALEALRIYHETLSDLQVLYMYVYSYWSHHEYHKTLADLLTYIHLLHLNIQLPFILELGFVLCLQEEPQLEPMRPPLTSKTPLHCSEQLLRVAGPVG